MLQATLKLVFSAALAGWIATSAMAMARNVNSSARDTRRVDTIEAWIWDMRLSRVVSASGISRAFVPPCIPGASLRTTGLHLSDQHRILDRNPRRTLLAKVFARDVPHADRGT